MSPRKRKSSEMEPSHATNQSNSSGLPSGSREASSHKQSDHNSHQSTPTESIHEDDICPICHLLIYQPVTTTCSHTLCHSCLQQWADISITTQLQRIGINEDDHGMVLLPPELEARCPMCRTETTASLDAAMENDLKQKYPTTYEARRAEQGLADEHDNAEETVVLYIGNTHQMVDPREQKPNNMHSWKFFVRPSRTDLIEEVHVHLHPTFRNSRVILQYPRGDNSYEIERLGWGYFVIRASVILKAGYSWVSVDAEDSPDGQKDGMLEFRWLLDFSGNGSQGRCRLKVKKEKPGQEREDERLRDQWRRLVVLQRERDPDYLEDV